MAVTTAKLNDDDVPAGAPDLFFMVLAYIVVVVGLVVGYVWKYVKPQVFAPVQGVSIFAALYIFAQCIERVIEPFTSFLGSAKDDDGTKFKKKAALQQFASAPVGKDTGAGCQGAAQPGGDYLGDRLLAGDASERWSWNLPASYGRSQGCTCVGRHTRDRLGNWLRHEAAARPHLQPAGQFQPERAIRRQEADLKDLALEDRDAWWTA